MSRKLYLTPIIQRGVPMKAFMIGRGSRFLSREQLGALPEPVLDVLSSVSNELFEIAFATRRYALAHDVGQLVDAIDREQKRRAA